MNKTLKCNLDKLLLKLKINTKKMALMLGVSRQRLDYINKNSDVIDIIFIFRLLVFFNLTVWDIFDCKKNEILSVNNRIIDCIDILSEKIIFINTLPITQDILLKHTVITSDILFNLTDDEIMSIFQNNLKNIRLSKNYSLAQAAKVLKLDKQTYYMLEKKRKKIPIDFIVDIMILFNVSLDSLFPNPVNIYNFSVYTYKRKVSVFNLINISYYDTNNYNDIVLRCKYTSSFILNSSNNIVFDKAVILNYSNVLYLTKLYKNDSNENLISFLIDKNKIKKIITINKNYINVIAVII